MDTRNKIQEQFDLISAAPSAYRAGLTSKQWENYQDMMLGLDSARLFTEAEMYELEVKYRARLEEDHRIYNTARLNNLGIEAERNSNLDLAIQLYEENIESGCIATHSFDRLMIIYRKRKEYENELRTIERAIEVFTRENEKKHLRAKTNPGNERYSQDLDVALETCTGLKNDEGWFIFSPYPIIKWIERREKALRLKNKSLPKQPAPGPTN